MKNDTILGIVAFLFFILLFLMILSRNELVVLLWTLITILLAIFLLKVFISNKNRILVGFKNQHIIIQILTVIFAISAIFELITIQNFNITWIIFLILLIAEFYQWFFKKEE